MVAGRTAPPQPSDVCGGPGQRYGAEAKVSIKGHQIFIWQKAPSPQVHPHRILAPPTDVLQKNNKKEPSEVRRTSR